jgi:hypothetical protein
LTAGEEVDSPLGKATISPQPTVEVLMYGDQANEWPEVAFAEEEEVLVKAPEAAGCDVKAEANRLLAKLEPFEHKIPHSDFLFIADCHDDERRITPSRLAKLRIIADVYAK